MVAPPVSPAVSMSLLDVILLLPLVIMVRVIKVAFYSFGSEDVRIGGPVLRC